MSWVITCEFDWSGIEGQTPLGDNGDYVGYVHSQGACGSCTAYSMTGAVQSFLLRQFPATYQYVMNGQDASLSRNTLFQCGSPVFNCQQGSNPLTLALKISSSVPPFIYNALICSNGNGSEPCDDQTCGTTAPSAIQATGAAFFNSFPDTNSMWNGVQNAPITCAIDASPLQTWDFQAQGPYDVDPIPSNHSVLIIGRGTVQYGSNPSQRAFLCRNSWGAGWPMTGVGSQPAFTGSFWALETSVANNTNQPGSAVQCIAGSIDTGQGSTPLPPVPPSPQPANWTTSANVFPSPFRNVLLGQYSNNVLIPGRPFITLQFSFVSDQQSQLPTDLSIQNVTPVPYISKSSCSQFQLHLQSYFPTIPLSQSNFEQGTIQTPSGIQNYFFAQYDGSYQIADGTGNVRFWLYYLLGTQEYRLLNFTVTFQNPQCPFGPTLSLSSRGIVQPGGQVGYGSFQNSTMPLSTVQWDRAPTLKCILETEETTDKYRAKIDLSVNASPQEQFPPTLSLTIRLSPCFSEKRIRMSHLKRRLFGATNLVPPYNGAVQYSNDTDFTITFRANGGTVGQYILTGVAWTKTSIGTLLLSEPREFSIPGVF